MTAEPLPDPDAPVEPLPEHLQRLAAELRAVVPVDDAPAEVLAGARAAWTWRLIDSELAELAEQDRAVLRDGPDLLVTFAAGEVFIDLERVAAPRPGTTLVVGQLTSPTAVDAVEAELAGEEPRRLAVELGAGGDFQVALPAGVPARLVVQLADGRRVVSSWLG